MQEFLARRNAHVAETLSANKTKLGRDDALQMAHNADRVIVAKGKSVKMFDMAQSPPDDETLARAMLGPTGNLRAPTLRIGRTVLVGFHEETFTPVLQGDD